MPLKKIGSPHPKYLAATDILISDMSNIIYDFLLFNRPIILIANEWLRENFPDLGIKTDLDGLEDAISRSIKYPGEFEDQRKYWLKKSIFKPDGNSSKRVIDVIVKKSGIINPFILLIHAGNEVSKMHLIPILEAIKNKRINAEVIKHFDKNKYVDLKDRLICIATHNQVLNSIEYGYKVHIDHSVKGMGTTDIKHELKIYESWQYCPGTDLHITEGETSQWATRIFLGPYKERAVMAGYPKSDTLLYFNKKDNKKSVCEELNFNIDKLLITYAPTGKYRYPLKQGASLSNKVLDRLKKISVENDYNILVKFRSRESFFSKTFNKLKMILRTVNL
jgi:CDP-glycerol glycerophosphotransferase (TagB/SpsB family)